MLQPPRIRNSKDRRREFAPTRIVATGLADCVHQGQHRAEPYLVLQGEEPKRDAVINAGMSLRRIARKNRPHSLYCRTAVSKSNQETRFRRRSSRRSGAIETEACSFA
jgi:hypothetical protein